MSRDVDEMKEIRREKENIKKLMKRYKERNEELNAKEEALIKKMETARCKEFDWRQLMEGQQSEGYIVCESIFGLSRLIETPETRRDKIVKLREEVLQKQLENMKLEKELESRKEEHRRFHEILVKRKEALHQCLEAECPTFFEARKFSDEMYRGAGNTNSDLNNISAHRRMSDELKKNQKERDTSVNKEREKKDSIHEKESIDKKRDFFPAINMAMNIMKLPNVGSSKESSYKDLRFHNDSESEKTILKDKLQEKLNELLEEQQALAELYVKAARAAKEKEEEYKERIAALVEQTDKDKKLMDFFRNL